MGFYEFQCGFLATICAVLKLVEHYLSRKTNSDGYASPGGARDGAASALSRKYLIVYGLAMGADWLQGPYGYSLYADQYGFDEQIISYFFITGFLSGAMFAPLLGSWADQNGRKRVCLVYCVLYAGSCLLLQVPWVPAILLARIFGGISTSILFSVFESWLVSAHADAALPPDDLGSILGRATMINGLVATVAGIFSNHLIEFTGHSYRSPFIASALVLVLAFFAISGLWTENYGAKGNQSRDDSWQWHRMVQAARIVADDPVLLILGLTQTLFEGSMYLFVFVWVPTLQDASPSPSLPLGYIFSTFMICMMLGSLLYTFITGHIFSSASKQTNLTLHVTLSALLCAVAALAFAICVNAGNGKGEVLEQGKFWAFCLFEACVGMYYPVQGVLRGNLISNEHRATLSALFRVPQNIFVVLALATGFSSAKDAVLFACALLLSFSALVSAIVMLPRVESSPTVPMHLPTPVHAPTTPASALAYPDSRIDAPYAGEEEH
ncbi:DUF791-domain-containing protein [Peniophora sp. CONT]|nr:DUF791-domain-containing protein [Peniophora sp. CONT]